MDFLDVNVLINAYRPDAKDHIVVAKYVNGLIVGAEPFAIASVSLSALLRIATHSKIFIPPSPIDDVLKFIDQLKALSHCLIVEPGDRHWDLFVDLCRKGQAQGNLISDAYLAAMAIEIGAELVTDDRGFARWPGLRWRHPAV